jgi:UDP-N-acetylmuramyl pentapeptide synthase
MKKFFKKLVPLKLKYLIASLQRRRLNHVTFIGITGSAGKTTTKDLSAAILANFGPCQKTSGSSNAPLSVAGIVFYTHNLHRYCVAESAAYGPGTMDMSVRILKANIAVVTVIGRDHYNAYKSMEGIVAEKEKLVLGLSPHGTAVLNIDDQQIRSMGERCNRRIIWFGKSSGATLRLIAARSNWPQPLVMIVDYQGKTYEIQTQLHGTHMAISVLASLGITLAADLPLEKAILAIAQFQPPEGRMQVVTGEDGVVFIRDDWKAPQWSLNEPLEFLRDAKADRKIAVVGTISDSSGDSKNKYEKICKQIRKVVDIVVFVGPHAHRALRARKDESDTAIQGFTSICDAANYLQSELRRGDLVLLKGSHKADHLVRLIINRTHPIQCWKSKCNVKEFCDKCPELYEPSHEISFVTAVSLKPFTNVPL